MDQLAVELGTTEFLQVTRSTDAGAKPLLTIQMAKAALPNAMVSVVQHLERSNFVTGHTNQAQPIPVPTFEDVKAMPMTHPFWDGSGLSHPDKPWAINNDVKTGIQAWLTRGSAREEVGRIGREVRQLILWALDYQKRVDDSLPAPGVEEDVTSTSLHAQLTKASTQLWMRWDPQLQDVLRWTASSVQGSNELDQDIKAECAFMILGCRSQWEKFRGRAIISAEVENPLAGHENKLS
ncbi:hypothetical protein DFH28DRAFT_1117631 [Melampsora americana]|nr:hypothetical protein DFH28DRAFT_1117631 [Melampsora americana]